MLHDVVQSLFRLDVLSDDVSRDDAVLVNDRHLEREIAIALEDSSVVFRQHNGICDVVVGSKFPDNAIRFLRVDAKHDHVILRELL